MKLTIEQALVLARKGAGHDSPGRAKLVHEARRMLNEAADALIAQAEKEHEAACTLVDVQVYENMPALHGEVWVKRVFSDGRYTKALEARPFAQQLKYTFDAGKKAGEKSARETRCEDER